MQGLFAGAVGSGFGLVRRASASIIASLLLLDGPCFARGVPVKEVNETINKVVKLQNLSLNLSKVLSTGDRKSVV